MTPPLPVRQLADVLEEEAGGNLYAVLSMEDGDCEPLVLDSDLTAEMAPDVDLLSDELQLQQSVCECAPPAETGRVDMTVQRFEERLALTVCLGEDAGVVAVFASPTDTEWPTVIADCLDALAPLERSHDTTE